MLHFFLKTIPSEQTLNIGFKKEMQKVMIRATNSYLIQCSLPEIYGVDTARSMTPLLNYALSAEMLRSEPRGEYQFA